LIDDCRLLIKRQSLWFSISNQQSAINNFRVASTC
jgi:hypothetical protein